MLANPGEQLNQVQLVEQVVLEPQNQLLVRLVAFDRDSPLPQVVHGRDQVTDEMARAHVDQLRVAQAAGNRSVMKRICPDQHVPGMPAASIVIVVDVPLATCRKRVFVATVSTLNDASRMASL